MNIVACVKQFLDIDLMDKVGCWYKDIKIHPVGHCRSVSNEIVLIKCRGEKQWTATSSIVSNAMGDVANSVSSELHKAPTKRSRIVNWMRFYSFASDTCRLVKKQKSVANGPGLRYMPSRGSTMKPWFGGFRPTAKFVLVVKQELNG